ncbi:dephospho-CoA kinase [Halobacteriovorax sp. JY17]|uniref:dephospho-CoA kinase n=1 Tax=Halobacteriovorax sp. JY17 TaxID=2014617 RepID=UPI0025BB0B82|nr:dephospho-CoA kinase [Halobacteriovorax sp. JY17]
MKLKEIFVTKTKEQRLYQVPCPVIGLTGGIATGKSSVSNLFQEKGINVICADKLVKAVYQEQTTINFITSHFPQVVSKGEINFKLLREIAFSKKENKEELEKFIYQRLPIVFKEQFEKIKTPELLIYDVPLLFEKNMQGLFDLTICVYTKREVQIERIIRRDNSSRELAEKILENQLPIDKKKELSDFCIKNSSTLENLENEFEALVTILTEN